MSISRELMAQVSAHLCREYPNEGCGILVGDGRTVHKVIACMNCSDDLSVSYAISQDDIDRAQDDADADGMLVIGFYHSHPDLPAYWSGTDAENTWVDMLYLICSVTSSGIDHTSVYLNGTLVGGRLPSRQTA